MNVNIADAVSSAMFFLLIVCGLIGAFSGLLSRKEFLSVCVVIDSLGLAGCIFTCIEHGKVTTFYWALMTLWLYFIRRDYKRWKDSDDDDQPRKRRRAWAKSKLPKPTVKQMEQPT